MASMMNRFADIDLTFTQLKPVYGYRSQNLVSLEKALELIQSEINELPFYIRTAKRHCHFPSERGLTHDESAAIYIYTMEWGDTSLYRLLNKALREENRQALKIWFPYLKLFDTALDKLPSVKEVVWRGVPCNIVKDFTKNQHVTWWSISSCSSSVNVIKDFLGNERNYTLFLIEAVNGKKIAGYTVYENEDEVILPMGTQFRVRCDALEQSNQSYIVHLIEVDHNNSEPLASPREKIHSPTSASFLNRMRPLTPASSQNRMHSPTPASPRIRMYSPTPASPRNRMHSPTPTSSQNRIHSPTSVSPRIRMHLSTPASNKGASNAQPSYVSTDNRPSSRQNLCSDCHAHDYYYYTGIIATPTYARCLPTHPSHHNHV